MVGRPSDNDALRMVMAFYCIMEPDRRAAVLALAEEYATNSQQVEGVKHFLLLQEDEPRIG